MPFPEAQRVRYGKPPLDQVVCQFRFPAILRIDSVIPVDFQERVRRDFPLFTEKSEQRLVRLSVAVAGGIEGQIAPEIESQIPSDVQRDVVQVSGNKNYEFISEDEKWKVNLTRTFVALSTQDYERWEGFKKQLDIPFKALTEVYSPNFLSRVGLRYVDIIKRSNMGLSNVSWDELLQPYVAGPLGSAQVASNLKSTESRYEVQLSDGESLVRVITRFVEAKGDGEVCFMIDSDFHTIGRMSVSDVMTKLDYFNLRASRLFQWSITPRLHQAMEPELL